MRIILATAALLLGFLPASAADTYSSQRSVKDAPAAAPVTIATDAPANWSGIWLAALAGYSMSNTELSLDQYDLETVDGVKVRGDHEGRAKADGFGGEGFDLTVQLGADIQIGRIVLGGWGEYSFGGVESSASIPGARLDVEQNDSYGAFARAGLVSGDTLFYGAAGYVWTEVDAKISGDFDTLRETFDFSGPAAELGVEHRFAPGIRGKLSARYTWLDEETLAVFRADCNEFELAGEPGVWSVKAGVVISTEAMFSRGLGIFNAE